jgi:hypothetical protein
MAPAPELRGWSPRAAVLGWFEPAMMGGPSDPEALLESGGWLALVADCEIVHSAQYDPWGRLKTAKRRAVLAGRAGVQRALAETAGAQAATRSGGTLDQIIAAQLARLPKPSQLELHKKHIVAEWPLGEKSIPQSYKGCGHESAHRTGTKGESVVRVPVWQIPGVFVGCHDPWAEPPGHSWTAVASVPRFMLSCLHCFA